MKQKDSSVTILSVEIEGTRPLLMNAPHKIGVPKSTKKVSNYVPEKEAESVLYKDNNDIICIPERVVTAAFCKAGQELKAPGKGRKSLKQFILSGIQIQPVMIPILPQEWSIDAQSVVVHRERIMRWRPKFDNWSLKFDVEIIDPGTISPTTMRNVIEDAGKFVGICDYRPRYGTFSVISVIDQSTGKEVK
jgi:hypothetical protein